MIETMYMGKPTGPSAGMILTNMEYNKSLNLKLRPHCIVVDGKYQCKVKIGRKLLSFGRFDTIAKCNDQYDKFENVSPEEVKKSRKKHPGKGYREIKNREGKVLRYEARLMVNKKLETVGYFKDKEDARAAYLVRWVEVHGPIPE